MKSINSEDTEGTDLGSPNNPSIPGTPSLSTRPRYDSAIPPTLFIWDMQMLNKVVLRFFSRRSM
jgi:hypothetical protein